MGLGDALVGLLFAALMVLMVALIVFDVFCFWVVIQFLLWHSVGFEDAVVAGIMIVASVCAMSASSRED